MSESIATLYDTDFDAWAHEQAEHLRKKRITKLDYDHLAEEIESLGKSDWRALESHLKNLILHCLKWTYQPQERARRGCGWQAGKDKPAMLSTSCSAITIASTIASTTRWPGRIRAPDARQQSRPDSLYRPSKTVNGRLCS
jgi:hypothetical protein